MCSDFVLLTQSIMNFKENQIMSDFYFILGIFFTKDFPDVH